MIEPTVTLAIKLASGLVHAEEYMSGNGDPLDLAAFDGIMADPEVMDFMTECDRLALLPVKR